jgi:hypothetical protein
VGKLKMTEYSCLGGQGLKRIIRRRRRRRRRVVVVVVVVVVGQPGERSRYGDGLRAERPVFHIRLRQEIFLSSTESSLLINVPGAIYPGVKHQTSESDHSPLSRAEVKNVGAIPP